MTLSDTVSDCYLDLLRAVQHYREWYTDEPAYMSEERRQRIIDTLVQLSLLSSFLFGAPDSTFEAEIRAEATREYDEALRGEFTSI